MGHVGHKLAAGLFGSAGLAADLFCQRCHLFQFRPHEGIRVNGLAVVPLHITPHCCLQLFQPAVAVPAAVKGQKPGQLKADEDMSELEETKSFDNIDANNVGESYDREMIKEPGERAQNLSENIIDESVETTKSENNEVDMADYVPDPRNEVLDEVVCAEKIEDSRDAVNENVGEMSEEQLNTVESEKTDYLELQEETSATDDIIYQPAVTKMLQMAKNKGCEIMNGELMLLYQGAESFKIWARKAAPQKTPRIF